LKLLIPNISSHCRDTFQFLNSLPKTIEDDVSFITFDVVSLYTNIPHDLGYRAIDYWIENYEDSIPIRFNKNMILNGLKLVLERNYFSFQDEIFLQVAGTAMGTKVAPTYASLVMGFLEIQMYMKLREIYPNAAYEIEHSWLRYLDDCWIIWRSEYGDCDKFYNIIQNLHPSIKFTKNMDRKSMNFLDVKVIYDCDSKSIHTDIYRKLTDTMNFVPFNSAHPRHVLHNIPYNLANRIKRIVSDKHVRDIRYHELKMRLLNLRYPNNLIDDAIHKAESHATKAKDQLHKTVIPFIRTYNKNNPDIFKEVIKPLSSTLPFLRSFQNCELRSTFRQPRSLISILSNKNRMTILGVQRCNESRCKTCDSIITGKSITFQTPFGTKHFEINQNLTCTSSNVIYKLQCRKCHEYYIGQTGDSFRKRITVHRQQIYNAQYSFLKVSKHIAMCGEDFYATPFFQLSPNASKIERERKEAMFIKRFLPTLNA